MKGASMRWDCGVFGEESGIHGIVDMRGCKA